MLLSLAVVGFIFVSTPSVVHLAGPPSPEGVRLELPTGYVLMSPLSRLLDGLTLLSVPQNVAVMVAAALLALAIGTVRARASGERVALRIALTLVGIVVSAALLELGAIAAPRPMARLRVSDPDIAIVDFHSHTGASHDARKGFSAEDRREWHRSGGFDVAYVSDHRSFRGAVEGARKNPARAGDGMVLLSAIEPHYRDPIKPGRSSPIVVLGLTFADTARLDSMKRLRPGVAASGRLPVSILALPSTHLEVVTRESRDSHPQFVAIELADAAPRGLAQLDHGEAAVRLRAAGLGLLLTAGSNNHGWGRTVAAWNLMTLPGWRAMPPDSVGMLIEQQMRARKPGSVTVVQRKRPRTHGTLMAFTLPVLADQVLRQLTPAERVVWLVWIWGLTGVAILVRRRRASKDALVP